jgi:hypothetical protein
LLAYAESGKWTQPFAEHDIGSSYPRADGHNDGGGENMPVEESANILIMTASYLRYSPKADAQAYAKLHYKVLKQWADYLLTVPKGGTSPNALDPQFQNQTDDFTGPIAHSVNLALKGILAVGAMGQISDYAGNGTDKKYYAAAASTMIDKWSKWAQSTTGAHLVMQYVEADTPQPMAWGDGIVGPHSIIFHGTGGAQTTGPVIDTTKSYTVSAWVKPNALSGYQTFVSIDGNVNSGFFLQLTGSGNYAFSAMSADDGSASSARATATSQAVAGAWAHITGIYDADKQTMSLYVNGVLQQTVPDTSAWKASGPTVVGRGLFSGSKTDFVNGSIDDVRIYQAALTPAEVLAVADDGGTALAGTGPTSASNINVIAEKPVAYWAFDEGNGDTSADLSGGGNALSLKTAGADPEDAWSLKYNAFPDKVLGLNLIPKNILEEEANFYKTKVTPFGIPLDIRHNYTKADWELWTAASTDDPVLRQDLVDGAYNFANTSTSRVPFSDWYDVVTGQQVGFQARPVIGGVFAILDRTALKANK